MIDKTLDMSTRSLKAGRYWNKSFGIDGKIGWLCVKIVVGGGARGD